jgi:hypothetical protein
VYSRLGMVPSSLSVMPRLASRSEGRHGVEPGGACRKGGLRDSAASLPMALATVEGGGRMRPATPEPPYVQPPGVAYPSGQ